MCEDELECLQYIASIVKPSNSTHESITVYLVLLVILVLVLVISFIIVIRFFYTHYIRRSEY